MNIPIEKFPVNKDITRKIEACINICPMITDEVKARTYRQFLEEIRSSLTNDYLEYREIGGKYNDYTCSFYNVIASFLYHSIWHDVITGIFLSVYHLTDMDVLSKKDPII